MLRIKTYRWFLRGMIFLAGGTGLLCICLSPVVFYRVHAYMGLAWCVLGLILLYPLKVLREIEISTWEDEMCDFLRVIPPSRKPYNTMFVWGLGLQVVAVLLGVYFFGWFIVYPTLSELVDWVTFFESGDPPSTIGAIVGVIHVLLFLSILPLFLVGRVLTWNKSSSGGTELPNGND